MEMKIPEVIDLFLVTSSINFTVAGGVSACPDEGTTFALPVEADVGITLIIWTFAEFVSKDVFMLR